MKNGAVEDEGVELTVFAAGIGVRGKIVEEGLIQLAAGETRSEDSGIDTDSDGAESIGVELADEFAGVAPPEGKEGGHTDAREICLAVGTEVFEEDVAESDFADALIEMDAQGFFHAGFVDGIDALRRDADLMKRQAGWIEPAAREVRGGRRVCWDALVAFGDGGEEHDDDRNIALLKKRVQRHGAVFAAAPAEKYGFRADRASRREERGDGAENPHP